MKKITRELRRLIRDEVKSKEVQSAKEVFLEEHFAPSPVWIMRPGVIPALSLCLVIALIGVTLHLRAPRPLPTSEGHETHGVYREASSPNLAETLADGEALAQVKVTRLASRVGTPMIYQKQVNGVPITIVWVFAGGK